MNALLVLVLLGMVLFSSTLSMAEDTGSCPTCAPVEGIQQPEYVSDTSGFKAMKAISSTGKCLVTIFCPENKIVVDVVTGISLSHEWFGFLEKLVKDKTGWFDPTVSGIKVGSNIAKEMSQNYKDTFKNITGKVPGLTILLPCLTAGNEIYRLYLNYVDSVDFGLDSFSITPVQLNLPKNDFFYFHPFAASISRFKKW